MKSWLNRDAWNRLWRTILQTVALVVVAPAVDAVGQVVQLAIADAAAGNGFEWGQVVETAKWAALMGVSMSVLAFVHRRVVDPSPIPSAEPPAPPRAAGGPITHPPRIYGA